MNLKVIMGFTKPSWHLLHMSKMIKTFSGIGMRLSTSLAWPEELPLLVAVVKNLLRVFFSITR